MVIETIREAKHNPAYPFAVVKPSAIGSFELFEKVAQNKSLSGIEQEDWKLIIQRFDQLANEACESGIVLMIDAEESWIQDGVDAIALPLMRQFNKEQVVIAITVQLYLNDNDQKYQSLHGSPHHAPITASRSLPSFLRQASPWQHHGRQMLNWLWPLRDIA